MMDSNHDFEYCLSLLKENDPAVEAEARLILIKFCDDIINNPNDAKYRKIFINNSAVEEKLMPALGAIECLFVAGFIENIDGFLLPLESPLAGVKELRRILGVTSPAKCSTSTTKESPSPVFQTNPKPSTFLASPNQLICEKNNSFFTELSVDFERVLLYENPRLQEKVKSLVPIYKLQIEAMKKLRDLQKLIKESDANGKENSRILENECTMEDLLLFELLRWFKHEFFEWVDIPKCHFCSSECKFERKKYVSSPQLSKIEVYKCTVCAEETEFPRYQDPEPLLKTRRGRCGEWANVFTLICRTFGYDARFISDKTDHVWTEVWSISKNRWVHVDPCEEAVDIPLMYEKGWNKKLSYVIAFSKDEIQDVTWRYTCDQQSVMQRRNLCTESSLLTFITKLNNERLISLKYSEVHKNYIIKRRLKELVDLIPAPPGMKKPSQYEDDNNSYHGRTSGSLIWRLARGEVSLKQDLKNSQKWIISKTCKNFALKYYILNDVYEITEEFEDTVKTITKKGWQSGIIESKGGIFRKVENDWKMVYLARSPESSEGYVKWTIENDSSATTTISSVEFHASWQTFEQGKVHWEIEGFFANSNKKKVISIPNCNHFETKALNGASSISVKAILSGGNNWQHAQLFRRSLESCNEYSMFINVKLTAIEL